MFHDGFAVRFWPVEMLGGSFELLVCWDGSRDIPVSSGGMKSNAWLFNVVAAVGCGCWFEIPKDIGAAVANGAKATDT